MIQTQTRPIDIAIERAAGTLKLTWADGHVSTYSLRWLRANCPCATCREDQRKAQEDLLSLRPMPSAEIAGAEFVGNYAIRLQWSDGHSSGIYAFAGLRNSCPCSECNPKGSPPLL